MNIRKSHIIQLQLVLLFSISSSISYSIAQSNAVAADIATMNGSDPRVDWAGRITKNNNCGSVSFDWLGVTARIAVQNASFVGIHAACNSSVSINDNSSSKPCTRLKTYIEDQNFLLYPITQIYVSPEDNNNNNKNNSLFSDYQYLWQGPPDTSTILTIENIVGPQYDVGLTFIHSFVTDGIFVKVPLNKTLGRGGGGPNNKQRRMEFVGDSITAATNVIRPHDAPACADWFGYQSDWSQTYAGLLCHALNASCSTIAVGGRCIMRECTTGDYQMPDYYLAQNYLDAPKATFDFQTGPPPDVIFINLGTNDQHAIDKLGPIKGPASFVRQMVDFMVNATQLYNTRDIHFFLNAGPMEKVTQPWTLNAIHKAQALGLHATYVDMTTSCANNDNGECDGCAGHPGIQAHYQMYLAALPIIKSVMGW